MEKKEVMKILITGANGFVGSNLCRHFLNKGWDVYGLVRRTSDLHFLKNLDLKLICGDLLYPEKIEIPDDIGYVIHSASLVSDTADVDMCHKNIYLLAVNLVRKILSLPRLPRRLVYISTALTLGFNGLNISEERPGESAQFFAYTRSKLKTEEYFLEQRIKNKLPVVILRPGDVYGPNDRTTCARLLRLCERGVPLIAGHGNWRFGFCYIDNLCQAVDLALLKEGIEGRAYSVSNNVLPTWRIFFSGLQKGLHKKQRIYVPVWFALSLAGLIENLNKIFPRYDPPLTRYRIKRITSDTTYDISRTIAELGYEPDNRTEHQIGEIVSWYLKERRDGYIK